MDGMTESERREYIENSVSPRGGHTREQLAKWGVPWPPPAGWKRRLIANGIPEEPSSRAARLYSEAEVQELARAQAEEVERLRAEIETLRSARTPVAAYQAEYGYDVVVCDDGTVWWLSSRDEGFWESVAPIPGTRAALARGLR